MTQYDAEHQEQTDWTGLIAEIHGKLCDQKTGEPTGLNQALDELLETANGIAPAEPKLRDGWEWNINGVGCDSIIKPSDPGNAVYVYGDDLVIETAGDDATDTDSAHVTCPADVAFSALIHSGIFDTALGITRGEGGK
jgi:hypothetical protein